MVVGQKRKKMAKNGIKSKTHQTHAFQKPGFPIIKTEDKH
jgi:hypothetical protein